jgi:hypothetical protein
MRKILIAYVGDQDLRAADGPVADQSLLSSGPIGWTMTKITARHPLKDSFEVPIVGK